jgi:hypothetical protein
MLPSEQTPDNFERITPIKQGKLTPAEWVIDPMDSAGEQRGMKWTNTR